MSRHALGVLEFARVLDGIADRAASEEGKKKIRALSPHTDPEALAMELGRVGAVMRFVEEKSGWGMPTVPAATGTAIRLSRNCSIRTASGLPTTPRDGIPNFLSKDATRPY